MPNTAENWSFNCLSTRGENFDVIQVVAISISIGVMKENVSSGSRALRFSNPFFNFKLLLLDDIFLNFFSFLILK